MLETVLASRRHQIPTKRAMMQESLRDAQYSIVASNEKKVYGRLQ